MGLRLAAGDIVTTVGGRTTTAFPKVDVSTPRRAANTLKAADRWLMANALAEAQARGNPLAALSFELSARRPSPVDKDLAEAYLFDPLSLATERVWGAALVERSALLR